MRLRVPRFLEAACLALTALTASGCSSGGETPPRGPITLPPGSAATTGAMVTEAAPSPDAMTAVASGGLSPSYVSYAINHVLSTGQSNSVANGGTPVLSKTQPYTNLMFDTGVMPIASCDGDGCYAYQSPTAFVPLVEGDTYFDYPVETASSGLANEATKLARQAFSLSRHDVLVTVNGRSGNTYWCLRKGSCEYHPQAMLGAFEQGLKDVSTAKRLADAAGLTYAVRAVTTVHGESDHYAYSVGNPEFPLDGTDGTPLAIADYADALVEWQRDYDREIKAITGQSVDVPLLVLQLSGWSDTRASRVAQMQLDAHVRAPGKVVLVAPGYALSYTDDCLHFDSAGERRLGEYFAKAYAKMIFAGQPWEPVRPKSIAHDGNTLTVTFFVPKAPLVLDTTRVTDPGAYGFEVTDAAGAPVGITKVAVTGADTLSITLASQAPGGTLRYAMNHVPGACVGPTSGARGNLRDSDTTPSAGGDPLYNWAVHFEIPLP